MRRSKSLRILELNFERSWRGGERQTLYSMQGFKDSGVRVALLCRKNYPMETKARAEGFKVISYSNIFGVLFYLILRGWRYDVLHAQTSHILTYCILSKPFHQAKILFTRRVDFVPRGRMTLLKYKLTDKVVAISNAIKNILEKFGAADVQLISSASVSKPLNNERARQILKEQDIPADVRIIGTTAAIVQHKDPLTMVEAVRELAAIRKDFVFLHFGKGNLEEQVRQKITEYGLEKVYRLMGFYENVEDVFSILDVFAMSSEQEGLGSSVLDAFMYKVPVVSTDAGGLSDLVQGGRGIACGIKQHSMLANGMNILLDKPEIRERIIRRAYDYTCSKHSLQHITSKYMHLLLNMNRRTATVSVEPDVDENVEVSGG
ncbi:Glycosyltransferase involved in cell wall bisynthesis [Chitinophaga sp. CF118]|uniref:glycosyltransferase family 4 protein n=1 Tax=Chitinophaga sp. CF118 TaxID=1884367 RepID=UPI0008F2AADD|nr:glycosyltransferase family 4 protein [Chitinophaga sp. CF118]SFD11418.1 Glycosyltransferase involved in cell wall bisynthesis [Chitinophaga sp. CF118]